MYCLQLAFDTEVGTQSPERQDFYAKIPEIATPPPKSCLDNALRAASELYSYLA